MQERFKKIAVIFSEIIAGLLVPVAAMMALFSVFLFDDPNFSKKILAVALFYFLLLYPLILVGCLIVSVRLLKKQKYLAAFLWSFLASIPALLVLIGLFPF